LALQFLEQQAGNAAEPAIRFAARHRLKNRRRAVVLALQRVQQALRIDLEFLAVDSLKFFSSMK
jgi:hypothetical protein